MWKCLDIVVAKTHTLASEITTLFLNPSSDFQLLISGFQLLPPHIISSSTGAVVRQYYYSRARSSSERFAMFTGYERNAFVISAQPNIGRSFQGVSDTVLINVLMHDKVRVREPSDEVALGLNSDKACMALQNKGLGG